MLCVYINITALNLFVILDVDFGYPDRPMLFKELNFGVDMDSRSMACVFSILVQMLMLL